MKKQRTQYNWKFKENESQQFYEWFENQDNISSSLRSVIYHVIEVYGTQDVLEPSIQKQIVKNSLILESLKGKNVINVDLNTPNVEQSLIHTPVPSKVDDTDGTEKSEEKVVKSETNDTKKPPVDEPSPVKNTHIVNYKNEVDPNNF